MMRLIGPTRFAFVMFLTVTAWIAPDSIAQQQGAAPGYDQRTTPNSQAVPRNQTDPRALQVQQAAGQKAGGQVRPVAGQLQANQAVGQNQPVAPFKPLDAAAAQRLNQLLAAWEQQSKATKTLTCSFKKWHYDLLMAPAGIFATKSKGVVKYRSPDKGVFREDSLVFFKGMQQGKPQFGPVPNKVGDYWVCNGKEVIEFDGSEKKCTITELPNHMRGAQIFHSPLPFVFNLDAKMIQQRYWVREVKAPKEGIYLIEAWPKFQSDRAQYKLVQIALDQEKFLPQALIMYAPNFNAKTAPVWDHYEFTEVKRNSALAGIQDFMKNFIPDAPPSDWKVVREKLPAAGQQASGTPPTRK